METYIDLHCHPSLKPYGQSFKKNNLGENSANQRSRASIWFYDSPGLSEKGIQGLGGICKFTQSDCSTLVYGNTRVVCASLYPLEKGFFDNKLGKGLHNDLALNFIVGVSKPRIDFVQNGADYFEDLEKEYQFYKKLEGVTVTTAVGECTYRLADSYVEIEQQVDNTDVTTIYFIITIEGMHCLQSAYDMHGQADEATVLANLAKLKQWKPAPFFVTLAHHFYNHLCGHAQSLSGLVAGVSDQKIGLNQPFTTLGKKVVDGLLDKTNGKRILIDIKHMSAAARAEYIELLNTKYADENIPLIVSHGAANGLRSAKEPVTDSKETAPKMLASDINFYDEEIVAIAKSQGIFALQLDERRIASAATLKNTKHAFFINKVRHYRAELLWNQVQHVAELLNRHNLFAWDCLAIGSDFDGIINPLNGFLTAEALEPLLQYLERYVHNYLEKEGKQRLHSFNQIGAAEIVNRIFTLNAAEFLRKNFV